MSARTSAARAPTARASASACSQIASDSSKRQASINPPASDRQRLRALRRGRLRRHELDRALERGEGGVGPAALVAGSGRGARAGAPRGAGRSSPTSSIARRASSTARGAAPDLAGELGCPGAELGEVEPGELGRVRHRGPQRERPLEMRESLREAEDGLRLACRLDRRDERLRAATRRRPVRRELRRRRSSAARELVGEPRVQLLALAGQDRRVDRLREQRVAEAEAAGRLVGDEDAVLDRLGAATRARRAPGAPRARGAAGSRRRVRRPRPGASRLCVAGSSRATRCSSRSRRPRGSSPLDRRRRQRRGAPRRRTGCPRSGRRSRPSAPPAEERPACAASSAVSSSVSSGPSSSTRRRARAPDAVGEAAHALRRGGLVRAVGREQQHPPVGEVVGEEDDEIERRRIGPVQILEHEQHGCGGCAVGEQRERVLEHAQLRARRLLVDLPRLAERPQGLDERLVRQLGADEIDRPPDEDLEPASRARLASSEASRVLPMPASPATRTVAPLPACAASSARSSSPSSRSASDEHLARASLHSASIAPQPTAGKALVSTPPPKIRQAGGER